MNAQKKGGVNMKKAMIVVLVLSLMLVGTAAFAAVSATKHNLTGGGGQSTRESGPGSITLCGFCHVPHGGATGATVPPLWGRRLAGTGTYTPSYLVFGGTVAGSAGVTSVGTSVKNPPGSRSLTCLSCHDGAWGLGVLTKNGIDAPAVAFIGNVVTPGTATNAASRLDATKFATAYNPAIGGAGANPDLRNDHPVGVEYRGVAAGTTPGPGLIDRTGSAVISGGRSYPLFGATFDVECASCHDPHTTAQIKFLRHPVSTLCQDCHGNK